jgi:hypothetical protein
MLPTEIGPLQEQNTPGACYLQFALVDDVLTFPQEVRGTLPTAIVLREGKEWTTINPRKWTQAFRESWETRDGDQFSVATLAFELAKDRSALLHGLWTLKPGRYVVLHHDLNGTVKVLGTLDEPAVVRVRALQHGGDPRREGNKYVALVEVSRRTECPFYLATPPQPGVPGDCPSLAVQIAAVDWATIEALLSSGQLAAAVASLCDSCPTLAVLIAAESWATIEGLLSSGQLSAAQASICSTLCELMDAAFAIPPEGGGGDPVLTMTQEVTGTGPLPVTGTLNGRDWHTNGSWGTFENYAEAYWTGSEWYVTDGNSEWRSTDDVASPDLIVNWTGGDAPYPVLTMEGGGETVDVGAQQIVGCWDSEQLERIQALVCTPALPGTVKTTDGEDTVLTVAPGETEELPQSVIKYKDAANADQVLAASNTEFVDGTLRAATQIPRRELFNDGPSGLGLYVSVKDLVDDTVPQVPAVVVGDPIIYAFGRSLWSGQVTSYRTGDEGSMQSAGFFDHTFTVGQNSIVQRLVDHNTLAHPNINGNTNRFTNRSGGAVSGSGNRFMRDHYTGIEYYLQNWTAGVNWNDAIDAGVAVNAALSETGWYLCPIRVLNILNEYATASVWTSAPFNAPSPRTIWSSTTNSTTSNAWGMNTSNQVLSTPAKTTTTNMLIGIYCRKFF